MTAGLRPRAWLFQGNPDLFDLDGYLRQETWITWTVRRAHYAKDIQVGDRVFLWRAAGRESKAVAGVVASAVVAESPRERDEEPAALPFWKQGDGGGVALRVLLNVDRVANAKQVIQRDWLQVDPVLGGLTILKFASQTNYPLDAAQAERLETLWLNTGRPWSRDEDVAGLWVYAQTLGQPISRSADSLVAEVAVTIGRAVGGVYNKVMNFRALDPRDQRSGLPGVGEMDRAVWAEFFDAERAEIRTAELEAAFRAAWAPRVTETRDTAPPARSGSVVLDPDEKTDSQGRVLDKFKRTAIEQHAMVVARGHYESLGYTVEDTHIGNPFDLRCRKGAEEIRVEVKGTTGAGRKVTVTVGEVRDAREPGWQTDLFIVHGILVEGDGEAAKATGGTTRRIRDWRPLDHELAPLTFEYAVTPDS